MKPIIININNKWEQAIDLAFEIMRVSEVQIGIEEILPNKRLPREGFSIHKNSHEFAYVIKGDLIFGTDREEIEIKEGNFLYNPPGTPHYTLNKSGTIVQLLWILSPPIELNATQYGGVK